MDDSHSDYDEKQTSTRIACMRCKHYQTTFDPKAQRACNLYQFKSNLMPYILVKQSTGGDCPSFSERPKKETEEQKGKKDFNDPKYW
jgi:hypothetical protein